MRYTWTRPRGGWSAEAGAAVRGVLPRDAVVRDAVPPGWLAVLPIFLLSGVLAVLQLAVTLFALALYDTVLLARSGSALALSSLGVAAALGAFVVLDVVRARVVCRTGLAIVASVDRRVLPAGRAADPARDCAALSDLERLARFAAGPGPGAISEAVWLPASVVAVACLHPILGAFMVAALGLMAALAAASQTATQRSARMLGRAFRTRLDRIRRPDAGGPTRTHASQSLYRLKHAAARRPIVLFALAKALRLALQAGALAVGAWLVIAGLLSPGALIAATIVMSRAFAAMDAVASHWRALNAARRSYGRIAARLHAPETGQPFAPAEKSDLELVDARERRPQSIGPCRRERLEIGIVQADPRFASDVEAVAFVKQDVDRHAHRQVRTQR